MLKKMAEEVNGGDTARDLAQCVKNLEAWGISQEAAAILVAAMIKDQGARSVLTETKPRR